MAFLVWRLVEPLANDGDNRRSVHVGIGEACQQIGNARSERTETDAGLTGKASIGIGHKRGRLFVTAQHKIDIAVHQ